MFYDGNSNDDDDDTDVYEGNCIDDDDDVCKPGLFVQPSPS